MRYRVKDRTVEAFQFGPDAEINSPQWFADAVNSNSVYIDRCMTDGATRVYGCTLYSQYGRLKVRNGDYIILEPDGELRPCREKNFKKLYERAKKNGS